MCAHTKMNGIKGIKRFKTWISHLWALKSCFKHGSEEFKGNIFESLQKEQAETSPPSKVHGDGKNCKAVQQL